ncbi:EAL domain-containing protein [Demequina soli]|uniref:EAL domain-containing protein n=1 Tax=Demequina soli TaxID=1638987 RepID=UPI00078106F6|nr:EAL domain-containing protein [Demequina soli]
MKVPPRPRLWHPPHLSRRGSRALVGRQGIHGADGSVRGHELLYRAPGYETLPIDLWPTRLQDRATEHVIAATFWCDPDITAPHPAFVNFTRSYLLDRDVAAHCDASRMVIEVVESAYADDTLAARLAELKGDGFRIAIDDFAGTDSQHALLPLADFVKVDFRDLVREGPALVEAARLRGATLIAERVEDAETLAACTDLGFDLYQGWWFGRATLHDRGEALVGV